MQGSEDPVLVINQPATVEYGGVVQLTSNHLQATPQPGQHTTDDIIYTLTPPRNNPHAGDTNLYIWKL